MFVLLQVFWMSDGRFSLGNSEKQQLCPPTAEAPVGPQKRTRKMSPHFEDFRGQEKKICLMRPRDVSLSREREKNLSGLAPPFPHLSSSKRKAGRKTDKRTTHVFKYVLHTPKP